MSSKNIKVQNLKAALGDGRTRLIYFGGIGIVIVASVIGYLSFSGGRKTVAEPSEVVGAPDMKMAGSGSDLKSPTPQYDKLVGERNAAAAEQAQKNGGSAMPVIRPDAGKKDELSGDQQSSAASSVSAPPPQPDTQTQQHYQDELQKRQQAIAARVAAMKNQVNLLTAAWNPKAHESMSVESGSGSQSAGQVQPVTSAAPAANAAMIQTGQAQSQSAGEQIAKAGDVVYAVLDTAVNTDEMSPVMATIVQGALKGSKLLGKIEVAQNAQKAVLHFTVLSRPTDKTSLSIDAVAIDPNTARTALASDVDNHYLLRYGVMFGASFLAGFSDALLKGGQNQQMVASPSGTLIQQNAFSPSQLVQIGVGNVGKTLSGNMSNVVNRPPTITIDAGIGMGILFMNDLIAK